MVRKITAHAGESGGPDTSRRTYVLVLEERIKSICALPLSLMDVRTMEVRPDEHFKKRAVFGILEEGKEEDWVKVLKRRAEASAVRKKRGLFPR